MIVEIVILVISDEKSLSFMERLYKKSPNWFLINLSFFQYVIIIIFQAYKRLLTEFHLKQDEVAERVSKSRTAVTNSMRLLKLCDQVQKMVIDDMISTGHARALISIEDPEEQYMIAQKIFDEKLSVREVEKLVKNLHKPEKPKKQEDKTLAAIYENISDRLKQCLSTKVSVSAKQNGSGKIEIEFYDHEDLERLLEKITG